MDHYYKGNVDRDKQAYGNWFIAGFIRSSGLRRTDDVEIKLSQHDCPFDQGNFKLNKTATTAVVLMEGECEFAFVDCVEASSECYIPNVQATSQVIGSTNYAVSGIVQRRRLRPGQYSIWAPLVAHRLTIRQSAKMFVVRWPSVPHDQVGFQVADIVRAARSWRLHQRV